MPTLPLLRIAALVAPALSASEVPVQRELAGRALDEHPWVAHNLSYNQGSPVHLALDTRRHPALANRPIAVYVVVHAGTGPSEGDVLTDARGAPQTIVPTATGLPANRFVLDGGSLSGESGTARVGVGYDVVLDLDDSGTVSAGDWVDGVGETAGFYVLPDLTQPGPYGVVEELFSGDGTFALLDIYYPSEVASLGELPLVIVSHGNGHNYRWYDHIGYHLASWGYIVVSHANNTGPGPSQAATTTLQNTDMFLERLDVIAGGALQGHVDSHRMTWIGHSRGGEGVVLAHRRLSAGNASVDQFTADDVKLISSIAPTDFRGRKPLAPVYHLWTGGADSDVNGCANCDICQTFHFYERAEGKRMSVSLHGVGHGDFHDGGGNAFAQGPCQVGRQTTHTVMRGILLPLVQATIDGNPACEEYLWRQWEDLHPIGAPANNRCVIVDLQYQEAPAERLVVDDFQRGFDTNESSALGAVAFSMPRIVEDVFDDRNNSFNPNPNDPMNGMTLAGPGDTTRGAVVEWDRRDEWMLFELPGTWDLREHRYLSFRAAQTTRQELTDAEPRDLTFSVRLWDADGTASRVHIGAYGGGVELPYQRRGCGGDGAGWANEFETIVVELGAFLTNDVPLDLSAVLAVEFQFGPSHGSAQGRIGLDEIEFLR